MPRFLSLLVPFVLVSALVHNPEPPQDPLAGRRICLDPGHDLATVPGAAARDAGGRAVYNEHDLTQQVALRVRELLQAQGAEVCLTRTDEGDLQSPPYDFNGNGATRRAEDIAEWTQPRIDWMNQFGAEIVLSIHFNGHPNPAISGTEVYYSDTGPYQDNNWYLSQSVLTHLLSALNAAGYEPVNRGLHSDAYKTDYLRYAHLYGQGPGCADCNRLFTLGNNPMSANKGTWQAGALVEVLFFSNPADVAFLMRPDAVEVIAQGLTAGIIAYALGY